MAKLGSYKRVDHPKYDATQCGNVNGFIGYRVTLYLIYDCERVYTFYNSSDWVDNVNLMRECGSQCSTFTHDVIVTPTHMHSIFKEIHDYVSEAGHH